MNWSITEDAAWGAWATPKLGRASPVHRWFLFPHSFAGELVQELIEDWGLTSADRVLDPFVGSGTTLVAAMEKGISGDGYDLSPLAVLASNTKTRRFERARLEGVWERIETRLQADGARSLRRPHCDLVRKALPGGRLERLDGAARIIEELECPRHEREFFQLALLAVIPKFSHAVASGGWLRWSNQGAPESEIPRALSEQVALMLGDLGESGAADKGEWISSVADARSLPSRDGLYSGVITSPPYPNRHDYTRVFGVELLFAFHDWEANRDLRYQTFQSHPEARPERQAYDQYEPPRELSSVAGKLSDARIRRMLEGYFVDMYLCLCEVHRVCKEGARAAFVLGNAQYEGEPVMVDEWTAGLGEQAGLVCEEIRAIRWRGNSAQQMGKFGRRAARESIVVFSKPGRDDADGCENPRKHRA